MDSQSTFFQAKSQEAALLISTLGTWSSHDEAVLGDGTATGARLLRAGTPPSGSEAHSDVYCSIEDLDPEKHVRCLIAALREYVENIIKVDINKFYLALISVITEV